MARAKLTPAQKTERSINRTPWKADVRNRLDRVREDIKMAVSASGWKIVDSGDSITLETLDGSAVTPRMREAEAAIYATFGYSTKAEATVRLSTQFWQRPREWLTGGLLLSAYTSLHAAEASRIQLLSSS